MKRFAQPLLATAVVAVMLALTGCPAAPKPDDLYAMVSTVTPEQAVAMSTEAYSSGDVQKAQDILNAAKKSNPASKEVWLRSAQTNFDTANYVQAIADAQEVLVRDNTDRTAQGVIVVSGLRLSTKAISELMKTESFGGDTRSEAEKLTRSLRESLGEITLVPGPQSGSKNPPTIRPKKRIPAAGAETPSATGGAPATAGAAGAAGAKAAAPAACPPNNPFCGL